LGALDQVRANRRAEEVGISTERRRSVQFACGRRGKPRANLIGALNAHVAQELDLPSRSRIAK
jgi:hypothetical protein